MGNEKLKIIVDDNSKITVWMDGKEVHGTTKIKFECEVDSIPSLELDFLVPVISLGGKTDEK